ncbi:MAG: hypothetical protein NVSMB14_10130 [Isosphaeraceae bacterium]
MQFRLVALDEGPDILLDRAMLVVGRHPQCDARLDSIRVSRHHCCMSQSSGEVLVRDLNSTNGIRINGQRVAEGRLRPGDELSIAHIRFQLDDGQGHEVTMAGPLSENHVLHVARESAPPALRDDLSPPMYGMVAEEHRPPPEHFVEGADTHPRENALAAAVRDLLPLSVADKCRIQVIVRMQPDTHEEDDDEEAESAAAE